MKEKSQPTTFLEHLEVFRGVIFAVVGVYALLLIPGWCFSQNLIDLLLAYAAPPGFKLHYFTLMEPFILRMKMTAVLAGCAAFPFTMYKLWSFVSPGLTDSERHALKVPAFASFFLGLFGGTFALLVLVPAVIRFSLSFAGPNMEPVIGIDSFVSLLLMIVLATALMFQFPLVLVFLMSAGIVKEETLRKQRGAVLVIVLIVAAILTPPDILSQILVAIPAYALFELSLLFYHFHGKRQDHPADEKTQA